MNFFAFGNTLAEGRQQRKEIEAQREIEKFNIENDKQNARLLGQQTSAREEALRRDARKVLGAERAGIAQSGVGFGGSSLDVMRRSTAAAELDALNIRYAGDLERTGILNQIEMREYNNRLLKLRGKQVMRMRWGAALGNLFGGAGGYGGQKAEGYYGQSGQQAYMDAAPTTSTGASWTNGYGASTYSRPAYSGPVRSTGKGG